MHPAVLGEVWPALPTLFSRAAGAASSTNILECSRWPLSWKIRLLSMSFPRNGLPKRAMTQRLFSSIFNSDQLAGFLSWQDGGVWSQYAAQLLLQFYPNIAMGILSGKWLMEANWLLLSSSISTLWAGFISGRCIFSTFAAGNNGNPDTKVLPQLSVFRMNSPMKNWKNWLRQMLSGRPITMI